MSWYNANAGVLMEAVCLGLRHQKCIIIAADCFISDALLAYKNAAAVIQAKRHPGMVHTHCVQDTVAKVTTVEPLNMDTLTSGHPV